MRAGDTYPALVARARYLGDDLLDLPLDTVATVTVQLIGSDPLLDTPAVDEQPIAVTSSTGGVVTFTRQWASGAETAIPGRYSVTIRAIVGGKAVTFPSSGRSVLSILA